MPEECNADLFFKLVQDIIDIAATESSTKLFYHDWRMHGHDELEKEYDAHKLKLEELRKTASYDAKQFYTRCVLDKATKHALGLLVARFPPG